MQSIWRWGVPLRNDKPTAPMLVLTIFILVGAFALYAFLRHALRKRRLSANQFFALYAAVLLAILLVFLGLTGRLHPLFALLGLAMKALLGLAIWLPRALQLAGIFQIFRNLAGLGGMGASGRTGGADSRQGRAPMTEAEALRILDLEPNATEDEIIAAHRRKMQRAHPDKGGTTADASRLNAARDLLLRLRGQGKQK